MPRGVSFDPARDPVEVANELVPIDRVLSKYGVEVPSLDGTALSMKFRCVWGYNHPDQGATPTMRLYGDTNQAFCFAGCGVITPVALEAGQRSIPWKRAARELLAEFGFKPLHWTERIEKLEAGKPAEDRDLWSQALVTYVRAHFPGGAEYGTAVLECVDAALQELAQTTEPTEWLERWKHRLSSLKAA